MVILFKHLPEDVNERNHQNFSLYNNLFSIGYLLHKDKLPEYKSLKDNPALHNDMIASLITNLFNKNVLKNSLLNNALECCQDILCDCGFSESALRNLHSDKICNRETINLLLIAGCQTPSILNNRVEAAVELCEELVTTGNAMTIIFSGKNNKDTTARIKDESRRMSNHFIKKIKASKIDAIKKILHIEHLFTEGESGKTSENIHKFIELMQGKIGSSEIDYNLFLISSTFHLRRLADEVEKRITDFPFKIKTLVVVGAEDIGRLSKVSKEPNYVKHLFFEVYSYLSKKIEFWKIEK